MVNQTIFVATIGGFIGCTIALVSYMEWSLNNTNIFRDKLSGMAEMIGIIIGWSIVTYRPIDMNYMPLLLLCVIAVMLGVAWWLHQLEHGWIRIRILSLLIIVDAILFILIK